MERRRLLEESDKLLNLFENKSKILIHSQEKDFYDENFQDIRVPDEHQYFQLTHQYYYWK